MASTKMRGNKLALTLGSPGENYWADATSVMLDNEEATDDVVTFEDAAGGGAPRQWFFTLSAIQSTDPTSFWSYLWDNVGQTVAFTYAPHGNVTPTEDKPHFIGMCTIIAKPPVGGEASFTNTYTFEARLDIDGEPTLDRGGD